MPRPTPSIDEIWAKLKALEGKDFKTKTGLTFTYTIQGDVLFPSRAKYHVSKSEFGKALGLVPFDGPGVINQTVRGPTYVWALLHDPRLRG